MHGETGGAVSVTLAPAQKEAASHRSLWLGEMPVASLPAESPALAIKGLAGAEGGPWVGEAGNMWGREGTFADLDGLFFLTGKGQVRVEPGNPATSRAPSALGGIGTQP